MESNTDSLRKLKICLVTYSCEPGRGSEEGIGWGWTEGLSKYVDIVLVTRKNNLDSINRGLNTRNITNVTVYGCDFPKLFSKLKKGALGTMIYHYLWHLKAAILANKLIKNNGVELIHHLTFSVTWQPCWASLVSNEPTVWGPLDGAGLISQGHLRALGSKQALLEINRACIIWLGENIDPLVSKSYKQCSSIITRTRFIRSKILSKRSDLKMAVIPDTCLSEDDVHTLSLYSRGTENTGGCRVCFLGRLVPRKGAHLAISSFSEALKINGDIELIIIGDGPDTSRLKNLAQQLGCIDKVTFTGRLPRNDAWRILGSCDIFLYPSLRDAVCTSVLEAMAAGLPVICLDNVGPAQVVDGNSGIIVESSSYLNTVHELSGALTDLILNKELRIKMGAQAQRNASNLHTFKARAEAIMPIYLKVIEGRTL